MAEIKIEKKTTVWPWILLGLIVLALVWYFLLRDSNDNSAYQDDTTGQVITNDDETDMNYSDAIARYSAYIGDTDKMGIDHKYSHGALTYLIDAIEAKANMLGIELTADLEEARKEASKITEDPYEVNHADLIKSSGKIITRALTTLQEAKFPNLAQDLANVDAAVSEIDKAEHTLDQKGDVNKFFKSAESLLLKMQ